MQGCSEVNIFPDNVCAPLPDMHAPSLFPACAAFTIDDDDSNSCLRKLRSAVRCQSYHQTARGAPSPNIPGSPAWMTRQMMYGFKGTDSHINHSCLSLTRHINLLESLFSHEAPSSAETSRRKDPRRIPRYTQSISVSFIPP